MRKLAEARVLLFLASETRLRLSEVRAESDWHKTGCTRARLPEVREAQEESEGQTGMGASRKPEPPSNAQLATRAEVHSKRARGLQRADPGPDLSKGETREAA